MTAAPLVIGATGGSGTRVFARIAREAAGYDLGTGLNIAEDAVAFERFHDVWVNHELRAEGPHPAGPYHGPPEMVAAFRAALASHRKTGARNEPADAADRWGWKAPRTMLMLPFLHAQFPQLKFIHVIRDGRDVAFSKNQNQARKHGCMLLSNWRERWLAPLAVRSATVWARANLRAAEYAERRLGADQYMVVRFEDLCADPRDVAARILNFLGGDATDRANAIAEAEVEPPSSMGRWREHRPALVRRIEEAAGEALRKFGYSKA